MSLKKFQAISHFLHFADNSTTPSRDDPTYDPLWKVRSVIQAVQQAQMVYTPGEHIGVDESMIGTKGQLWFLQYMPKKPTKWGIKVWVCSKSKTLNPRPGTYTNFKCTQGKVPQVWMD